MTARTEYGAQLPNCVVYLHDFSEPIVRDFVAEMCTITPVHLVTREWVGDVHGKWEVAG